MYSGSKAFRGRVVSQIKIRSRRISGDARSAGDLSLDTCSTGDVYGHAGHSGIEP